MNKQIAPLDFTGAAETAIGARPQSRWERFTANPIRAGGIIIGVFVVGFFVWASFAKIAGGVPAPGTISVENNRKTVQHLEGGIVRKILVREGQEVKQGQVLLVMDDNTPRAQVDVLRGDYDALTAQKARLEAEISGASSVSFPAELLARRADPKVARVLRDEETLFKASLGVYQAQTGVLGQRAAQLQQRVQGLESQMAAVNRQSELIDDELTGVRSLYERGYAPKTRMLSLERNAAELTGARGARTADIAGAQEAIGETRIQLAQVRQARATQAAQQLTETQIKLSELTPRLRAAEAVLDHTTVRAPVSGAVLGLTQFTEGGVAAPGQRLMDVVPLGAALVIQTQIRPDHIDEVREGMDAEIRLVAYKAREVPPIEGKVTRVSADAVTNDKGESFFTATLVVPPEQMKALPEGVKLAPGMPIQALIVTGKRTVMSYLLDPFKAITNNALREN